MATLTRDQFSALNAVQQPYCATIYLPTHSGGEAALHQTDAKSLKQQVKQLRKELEQQGLPPYELERFVEPLGELINDKGFWRKQSEGLALFLCEGQLTHFLLPFAPDPLLYLGNRFYLLPLLPYFADDGMYYMLHLGLEKPRLFKGSRYAFEEENLNKWVPEDVEAVVGSDFEPRNTQVRSVSGGQKGASFHGYGEGKDDRKDEIMQYIREVEKGISKKLHGETAPLVLGGPDYLIAMYRTANSYKSLYPDTLPGNYHHTGEEDLHGKTWAVVAPFFASPRLKSRDRFLELHNTPQTSSDISEILPAAIYGKVEALFLRKGADIWGIYDPGRGTVEIDLHPTAANTSLSELAATSTLLQGGAVYLLGAEEMPYEEAGICALYRY